MMIIILAQTVSGASEEKNEVLRGDQVKDEGFGEWGSWGEWGNRGDRGGGGGGGGGRK